MANSEPIVSARLGRVKRKHRMGLRRSDRLGTRPLPPVLNERDSPPLQPSFNDRIGRTSAAAGSIA